jgi:hypothetical protein
MKTVDTQTVVNYAIDNNGLAFSNCLRNCDINFTRVMKYLIENRALIPSQEFDVFRILITSIFDMRMNVVLNELYRNRHKKLLWSRYKRQAQIYVEGVIDMYLIQRDAGINSVGMIAVVTKRHILRTYMKKFSTRMKFGKSGYSDILHLIN